jgi:hypothetical protein
VTRLAVAAGTVVLALRGCGDDPPSATGPPGKLDETSGSFRGVRLGDSDAEVRRKLGEPERNNASTGIAPVGSDVDDLEVPPVINPPPGTGPVGDHTYRYRGVTFLTTRRFGVYAFLVTAPASTRRGVRIGDSLASVRERYPGIRCKTATAEGNAPIYDYCTGRVRHGRYIAFAGDPIKSITVATNEMD